jgi:hypothetical protein
MQLVSHRIQHRHRHFSTTSNTEREFFDRLGEALNIHSLKDWHKIDVATVEKYGGSFVKQRYDNSLIQGKNCIGNSSSPIIK